VQVTEKTRRKRIAEEYLSGKMERDKAVQELGEDAVEELDYALKAIEADLEWGAKPCPEAVPPSLPQAP